MRDNCYMDNVDSFVRSLVGSSLLVTLFYFGNLQPWKLGVRETSCEFRLFIYILATHTSLLEIYGVQGDPLKNQTLEK